MQYLLCFVPMHIFITLYNIYFIMFSKICLYKNKFVYIGSYFVNYIAVRSSHFYSHIHLFFNELISLKIFYISF